VPLRPLRAPLVRGDAKPLTQRIAIMPRPRRKFTLHQVPCTASFDEVVQAVIVVSEILERAERRQAEVLRRTCPKCGNTPPTIAGTANGVAALRCPRCHAAWDFDSVRKADTASEPA
jgi:hypothetical protein